MQAKPSLGSGLIGATLTSRVQQKQQQQQQPNISVSRPGVGFSNGSARFDLIFTINIIAYLRTNDALSIPCSRPLASSNTLLSELGAPSVVRAAPLQAQPPQPLSKPAPAPSPSEAIDTKKSDPFAPNANNAGSGVDSFADFSAANFDSPTPGMKFALRLIFLFTFVYILIKCCAGYWFSRCLFTRSCSSSYNSSIFT